MHNVQCEVFVATQSRSICPLCSETKETGRDCPVHTEKVAQQVVACALCLEVFPYGALCVLLSASDATLPVLCVTCAAQAGQALRGLRVPLRSLAHGLAPLPFRTEKDRTQAIVARCLGTMQALSVRDIQRRGNRLSSRAIIRALIAMLDAGTVKLIPVGKRMLYQRIPSQVLTGTQEVLP